MPLLWPTSKLLSSQRTTSTFYMTLCVSLRHTHTRTHTHRETHLIRYKVCKPVQGKHTEETNGSILQPPLILTDPLQQKHSRVATADRLHLLYVQHTRAQAHTHLIGGVATDIPAVLPCSLITSLRAVAAPCRT